MAEEDPERSALTGGKLGMYGAVKRTKSREHPSSIHYKLNRDIGRTSQSIRGNVWSSMRSMATLEEDVIRMVPTLLKDDVRLFTNSALESPKAGVLYMRENCFYNKDKQPEYALSINHDIYKMMMKEVNDSANLPLGIYFCCHGGEGAHSGVSHDDYVDIRVAWILLFILFLVFLVLVFVSPWSENDDDFFP